jgi:hypothetical protein
MKVLLLALVLVVSVSGSKLSKYVSQPCLVKVSPPMEGVKTYPRPHELKNAPVEPIDWRNYTAPGTNVGVNYCTPTRNQHIPQ